MTEEKTILDLAKSNMAAPDTRDTPAQVPASNQISEDNSVSKALDDLLSKVTAKGGWIPVKLPSLGKYNEGVGDTIEIKPFNFEDEKILRSVTSITDIKSAITTLFHRCTKGIPYPEMSLVDKGYILYKLREISYGNEYPIEAECASCQEKNELVVELDKLGTTYVENDAGPEISVTLPDSEVEAVIRVPRTADDVYLENPALIMDNLWRFVVRLGKYDERTVIQNFLSKTSARDAAVIRETAFGSGVGLDSKVRFKCIRCGNDQSADLPLNENFFSVS